MPLRRANVGAGSVVIDNWVNYDIKAAPRVNEWDIRTPLAAGHGKFDTIVLNHVLNHLRHHHIPKALDNIYDALLPKGCARVSVPDLARAVGAWIDGDRAWFPQNDVTEPRVVTVDDAFCTYVTWFGTQKSVFTRDYLTGLIEQTKFWDSYSWVKYAQSYHHDPAIVDLDDREHESLFVDLFRWP